MTICSRSVLPVLFLWVFCVPAAVQAGETTERLTEDNVSAFIEKTTEITGGGQAGLSRKEILRYLDTHIDEDAFFKSTMKYNMPGYPPQETAMNLDKEEFIQSIETGAETIGAHQTDINIKSIKISSDGERATVQTVGHEQAVMPLEVEGQNADIPIAGTSSCLQIIKLSDDQTIQMHSAICTTDISFNPAGP